MITSPCNGTGTCKIPVIGKKSVISSGIVSGIELHPSTYIGKNDHYSFCMQLHPSIGIYVLIEHYWGPTKKEVA